MLWRGDRIDGGSPREALGLRPSYAAIPPQMEPFSNLPDCCALGTDLGGQVSYREAILIPKEGVVIMKKMLLASTAILTLVSGSAMAADMTPAPAPAPVYSKAPMAPTFTWTGFYIGGDGGYGFATSSGTSVSALGSVLTASTSVVPSRADSSAATIKWVRLCLVPKPIGSGPI
jgi:hypothetical protein